MLTVIMQAVETGIVEAVGRQPCTVEDLLRVTGLKEDEGQRFVALLVAVGIMESFGNLLSLSAFSRRYLFAGSETNQLNALAFEQVLIAKWGGLGDVLRNGQSSAVGNLPPEEYQGRLSLHQKAMHEAALMRSRELWDSLPCLPETGVVMDIGAGDGTYLNEFLKGHPQWRAIACDLPDVLAVNRAAYENTGITTHACNVAADEELRSLVSHHKGSCSVILLSNIIHCYSRQENLAMISRLGDLLTEDGMLVIHDFFTDGNGFGALYDIHMMVNTYNGRTYSFAETSRMLQEAGFADSNVIELQSCSHAVIAGRRHLQGVRRDTRFLLHNKARALGFFAVVDIDPATVPIEPWVKAKCRYGCMFYGKKWSCPPHSLQPAEFRELLGCYTKAVLVAGQPPLREFQERLLDLEKTAFLHGCKKALAFSGGPCSWCESCAAEACLFPEKRRPSLEACGCDVFSLAENYGIPVAPVRNRGDFVQYIGLLLVE